MEGYICVAPSKEVFDFKGKSLGMQGERALYNLLGLSRSRIYRFSVDNSRKGATIIKYKDKQKAQELCDSINEAYNDDFEVKSIIIDKHQELIESQSH